MVFDLSSNKFYKFIYFWETERECETESTGGAESENPKQAVLSAGLDDSGILSLSLSLKFQQILKKLILPRKMR